jgi:hypothetical protein
MLGRSITLVSVLAACGGGESEPDAYDGPCWPLPSEPGGEVQMGTGDIAFEEMPDLLVVTSNASQSDPFLMIHSRIRGMPPGNPNDAFDRANPKTKVAADINEGEVVLELACPASIGYVPGDSADSFDLLHSLRLGFGFGFPLATVDGKQARITVEVVGSNGLYARAEKLVTLSIPPPPDVPGEEMFAKP